MTHYSSNTNGNLPGDPPDSINSNTDSTTPSPESELANPDQHDLGQPDENTNGGPSNDSVGGQDQEEQNEENEKTVEDGMLVCQGALCNCSLGTMPAQLVVTSHRKYYVNDPQGAQKMVATTRDNALTNLNFGICKNGSNPPPPCAANLLWTKEHSTIYIESVKANVLSENSEAQCQLYPGKVTIMQNGQIPVVNAQNFKNVSVTAPAANCLVDAEKLEELKKEDKLRPFHVDAIRCGKISSDQTTNVESLKIRPEESLKFEAHKLSIKANQQEKRQIDWMVTRDGSPMYAFGNHGDVLEITFEETGTYRVEAHTGQRTANEDDGKILGSDSTCSLDVLVAHNSIKKITSEDIRSKNRVRIGPVVFTAEFEMPLNQKELDTLVWELKDNENGCLETLEKNVVFPTTKITNKMEYFVSASLGEGKGLTLKLVGNKNTVKAVQGTVNGRLRQVIRPDELIAFSVSEGQYGDNLTEIEQKDVKWKHFFNNAPDAGDYATGGSIPAQTYPVGNHIMEAYVSSYNAVVKTKRYDKDDDWEFEVTHNYIHKIVNNEIPKPGKSIGFLAESVMPFTNEEIPKIRWEIAGPKTGKTIKLKNVYRVKFEENGKYIVKCYLDNSLKKICTKEIVVNECKVIKGGWSDEDGNRIGTAGYKQEVYVYFEHIGLEGETVEILVYDDDELLNDVIYSVVVSIPDYQKEWYQVKVLLDDKIRKKIEDGFYGDYGKLFFKIKGKSVTIENDNTTFPGEKKMYLHVINKERVVSAYFADMNDRKRYIKADYTDPVMIQLYTTNLVDEEVEVSIYEKRIEFGFWDRLKMYNLMGHGNSIQGAIITEKIIKQLPKEDKELDKKKVKIDSQGQGKLDFGFGSLKNSHPKGKNTIRDLYLRLKYKETTWVFGDLRVYNELGPIVRNKPGVCEVIVDTFANEKHFCERCNADLTVDDIYNMFPDLKDSGEVFPNNPEGYPKFKIGEFVNALNKYMKDYNINTCRRKSYFLAQIAVETGDFKRSIEKKSESLANKEYANKGGNGNESSGDGYKYRGRGLIQLTFRETYKRFGEYKNMDFVNNPDLITSSIDLIVESSTWFWQYGKLLNNGTTLPLNPKATVGDFKRICVLIQGTEKTFKERKDKLEDKVKPVIYKSSNCNREKYDKVTPVIDFHIYWNDETNGRIEKHIPRDEAFSARYYYHDKFQQEHFLGSVDFHTEKWRPTSNADMKKGLDSVSSDVAELTNLKNITKSYKSGNVKFKILEVRSESFRFYIDIDALACFYGALFEESIEDLVMWGFSIINGNTAGGSVSHKNGMTGDLFYLNKNKNGAYTYLQSADFDYERQKKFVNALYKFGYSRNGYKILSENFIYNGESVLLPNCKHYTISRHNNHLHVQGLKHSDIFQIIEKK